MQSKLDFLSRRTLLCTRLFWHRVEDNHPTIGVGISHFKRRNINISLCNIVHRGSHYCTWKKIEIFPWFFLGACSLIPPSSVQLAPKWNTLHVSPCVDMSADEVRSGEGSHSWSFPVGRCVYGYMAGGSSGSWESMLNFNLPCARCAKFSCNNHYVLCVDTRAINHVTHENMKCVLWYIYIYISMYYNTKVHIHSVHMQLKGHRCPRTRWCTSVAEVL